MLNIQPNVRELLPGLRVFGFKATSVDPGEVATVLQTLMPWAIDAMLTSAPPTEEIAASEPYRTWRTAYSRMGLSPSKFRSSVESLTRRALKTRAFPVIGNPIVDIYNTLSIAYRAPVGVYDTTTLVGDLVLRFATSEDLFVPIGQTSEEPTKQGAIVYADQASVVCYGLNYRDCERTCVKTVTSEITVVSESLDPPQAKQSTALLGHFRAIIQQCGGAATEINEF